MFEDLSEEDRKALIWLAFLLVVLIVIASLVGYGYVFGSKVYDKETLCEYEVLRPVHRILLIDTTDGLSDFQSEYIQSDVQELISSSPVGTLYSVYLIEASTGGISGVKFDMCQPRSGENVSIIYDNPRIAERKFNQKFKTPFFEFLETLIGNQAQERSPVVEAISDIFKLHLYDDMAETKTIHLYSDLLQNSTKSSVYKGQSLPKIASCEASDRVDAISVHVLERPEKSTHLQNKSLLNEWGTYLASCITKPTELRLEKVRY